jgi:hypothetical protein
MFFSCATRPTKSASGRRKNAVLRRKARAVTAGELSERNAGGQHMHRHGDAVAIQALLHGR